MSLSGIYNMCPQPIRRCVHMRENPDGGTGVCTSDGTAVMLGKNVYLPCSLPLALLVLVLVSPLVDAVRLALLYTIPRHAASHVTTMWPIVANLCVIRVTFVPAFPIGCPVFGLVASPPMSASNSCCFMCTSCFLPGPRTFHLA